jgi:hypothetical protein
VRDPSKIKEWEIMFRASYSFHAHGQRSFFSRAQPSMRPGRRARTQGLSSDRILGALGAPDDAIAVTHNRIAAARQTARDLEIFSTSQLIEFLNSAVMDWSD